MWLPYRGILGPFDRKPGVFHGTENDRCNGSMVGTYLLAWPEGGLVRCERILGKLSIVCSRHLCAFTVFRAL